MGRAQRTVGLFVGVLLTASAGIVAGAGAGAAATTTDTSFTYVSQSGDYVGQGKSGSYSDPSTFFLSGGADSINVHIYTGDVLDSWDIRFAAPPGQQLTTGVYEGARRAGFNQTPGLEVTAGSRGCNALTGRFTIHALTVDAEGRATLLDASFTQYCEGLAPALNGTVHYAAPASSGPVVTASSAATVTGQPVTLTARVPPGTGAGGVVFYDGATSIGQGSFDAAGTARLTTSTLAAGTHSVTARVGTASSAPIAVDVRDGRSSMWFQSGFGEYVGGGPTASYVPTTADITFGGTAGSAGMNVYSTVSDDYWHVSVAAPPGQPLRAGTYTGAVRRGFEGPGQPGLEFYGTGRGCSTLTGEFTVSQVTLDGAGVVTGADISLVQYCDSNPYPLRARLRWNASGTSTQPVASTTALTATASGPLQTTLTATVTGGPAVPAGSVTFSEGTTTLGTAALDAQGRAVLVTTLTRGTHTVKAAYGGSATLLPSSATASVTLAGATSTTTFAAPRTTKLGKATSFSVTVTGNGTGAATGTVRLYDGPNPVATTATLVGGRATITWTPTAKGQRSLSVRYSGDSRYAPSTSATTTVKVT